MMSTQSIAGKLEMVQRLLDSPELNRLLYEEVMHIITGHPRPLFNAPEDAVADPENYWAEYNKRLERQGGKATEAQRNCGLVYPLKGRGMDFGHRADGSGPDGHHWKFMWHTPDGEPQVVRCRKCKYLLWRSQCHGDWQENSQAYQEQVASKYGGHG